MGGAASSLCMSAKSMASLAVPDFGLGNHDDEDPDVRDDDRSSSTARDMLRRFSTLVSPVTVERLGSHNVNFLRADRLSEQRSLPSQFRRTTSFTPPIEGAGRMAVLHAMMPSDQMWVLHCKGVAVSLTPHLSSGWRALHAIKYVGHAYHPT